MAIFSPYVNACRLFLDLNGTFRSYQSIHRECTNEMHTYFRARNFFKLWAYLFVNWYRHDPRKLWARLYNPEEVPVLETKMIVESHSRKVKHDYLYRFNRPQNDLVVWILTCRSIPQEIERKNTIQTSSRRRVVAS